MKAHWDGLDPDRAKSYWAYKLQGMPADGVRYALENLPKNPPTINEFIEIAGRRPRMHVGLLDTAPRTPKDQALKRLADLKARFPKFRKVEQAIDGDEVAA